MNAGTPENTNYLEPGAHRQNQILEGLGQRIAGFCATHWDINAMWLLREDLHSAKEFLGDGMSNGEKLKIKGIVDILDQCIDSTQMPDEGQSEHLLMISEDLHDIDQASAVTDAGTAEPTYSAGACDRTAGNAAQSLLAAMVRRRAAGRGMKPLPTALAAHAYRQEATR